MSKEISRMSSNDAGCFVAGYWGQYAVARMIFIVAEICGYDNQEAIDLARRKLGSMAFQGPPLTDEEEEKLSALAEEAEEWLSENIVPEGYYFGWLDGEFYLQSEEWWSQA